VESQIKDSLGRLLGAIGRSDAPAVEREMGVLDGILERERAGLPAQLAHFLERRSYAKALAYLSPDERRSTAAR
jgi:hypothetical protein